METLRTLLSDNEKQWIEMHPIRVSGCRIYIKITNTHTHNTTRLPLQYWLKHTLLPSSTKHDLLAWSLFNKVQKRSVWAWWMFGPRSYQSSSHWYEVTIWMQELRTTINKKCGVQRAAGRALTGCRGPSSISASVPSPAGDKCGRIRREFIINGPVWRWH